MPARRARTLQKPDHLAKELEPIWDSVVERGTIAPTVDPIMLEAYCTMVARWRAAAETAKEEGLVVDGGEKRGAITHPALAVERSLIEQIRRWSPLVNWRPADRKAGPMFDATKRSIAAVDEFKTTHRFDGPIEAVKTMAWLIDEAQRAGTDALQKASYVLIPTYLKACAELQITPASVPDEKTGPVERDGKITKFSDAAARRRQQAS